MKYLFLVFSLLFITIEASAQIGLNESGLILLEKKWQIMPSSAVLSALNEDPFRANAETNRVIQDRKDNLRENEIRRRQGLPIEAPRVRFRAMNSAYRNSNLNSYTYQIKVENKGTKKVQTVVWDYVFFDRTTNQEVGRHQFTSKTNLKPGKTDKLVIKFGTAPTNVVHVKNAGKKPRDQYVERVIIRSVSYKDGSVWNNGSN